MMIRKADIHEHDDIFLMGYDVWAENLNITQYLQSCRESMKYKSGTWYVLEKNNKNISSLIVYNLSSKVCGLGSIATAPEHRKQGYASFLIQGVLQWLELKNNISSFFLYSDIDSSFYQNLAFMNCRQNFKNTIFLNV